MGGMGLGRARVGSAGHEGSEIARPVAELLVEADMFGANARR